MKKTPNTKTRRAPSDELSPEYHFDYSKARPNRFASRAQKDRVVVVLESDVAQVFTTPEAVNRVLRALIATMPATAKGKRRA